MINSTMFAIKNVPVFKFVYFLKLFLFLANSLPHSRIKTFLQTVAIPHHNVQKRNSCLSCFKLLLRSTCACFNFVNSEVGKISNWSFRGCNISGTGKKRKRNKTFFDENIKIEIPLESIEKMNCAVLNASTRVRWWKAGPGYSGCCGRGAFFLTGRIHKIKALRRGNCSSGHEAVHQMNEKKFPR